MLFTAAQVLAEHPDGVATRELWPLVKVRLSGLEDEWKPGGVESNTPELALGYKSGGLVKSGWVTKSQGRWRLTPLGRIALREHPDVSSFIAAANAAYQYWDQHRTGFETVRRLLEAVPEGGWVAANDLAAETGLDPVRLVCWLQGELPEGWHRALDSDGGLPDAAHPDEGSREQWLRLLEEHHYGDGIDVAERYGLEALRRAIS